MNDNNLNNVTVTKEELEALTEIPLNDDSHKLRGFYNEENGELTIRILQYNNNYLMSAEDFKGKSNDEKLEFIDSKTEPKYEYARFHVSKYQEIVDNYSLMSAFIGAIEKLSKKFVKEVKEIDFLLLASLPKEGEPLTKVNFKVQNFTRVSVLTNYSSKYALTYFGDTPKVYYKPAYAHNVLLPVEEIQHSGEQCFVINSSIHSCVQLPYAVTLDDLGRKEPEVCTMDRLLTNRIKISDMIQQQSFM